MKESHIQTTIKNKLTAAGWFVTKLIVTSTPGFPDLLCLRAGRIVMIEVKRPGCVPDPLQAYMHDVLRSQGVEVIVATNLIDISHLCPLDGNLERKKV